MLQATKGILTQAIFFGPDFLQPMIEVKKSSLSNKMRRLKIKTNLNIQESFNDYSPRIQK